MPNYQLPTWSLIHSIRVQRPADVAHPAAGDTPGWYDLYPTKRCLVEEVAAATLDLIEQRVGVGTKFVAQGNGKIQVIGGVDRYLWDDEFGTTRVISIIDPRDVSANGTRWRIDGEERSK